MYFVKYSKNGRSTIEKKDPISSAVLKPHLVFTSVHHFVTKKKERLLVNVDISSFPVIYIVGNFGVFVLLM